MTVSWDELEHWHPDKILQVLYVVEGKHKTLGKLGDTLDGIKTDLSDWGGASADAWRAEVGKRRTDIIDQQHQLESVRKALDALVPKVWKIIDERERIKSEVANRAQYGWKITSDGRVVGDTYGDMMLITIQQGLDHDAQQLLKDAASVDQELADAIHRAVSEQPAQPMEPPKPPGQNGDNHIRDMGSQERPGVTDINDPGVAWQAGLDPEKWKNSYQNPQLADNPPGVTLPAGAERDAAWQEYLKNYPKDGTRGFLPNPDAVQDKGLKVLGNAGEQLGTSYAWAGGDMKGPGKGSYNYDKNGNLIKDESYTFNDPKRVGFDCSGLTEYAAGKVNGGETIGTYTGSQLTTPNLVTINPGEPMKPGDLIYYGDGTGYHTAVYVAPGVIVNAPGSGQPVQLDLRGTTPGSSTGEFIRVRRVP